MPELCSGIVLLHFCGRDSNYGHCASAYLGRLAQRTRSPTEIALPESIAKDDHVVLALINTKFGDTYWPGEDPIGKRFRGVSRDTQWMTVVGVVPDLQVEGPNVTGD